MTSSTTGSAVVTLPSDTTIKIVREFAAPPAAVWRVWTEPELIRRWWAGHRGAVTSIEMDLREGGAWRFVMTANPGFEVAFHGVNREIVVGERLVSTEVYEAVPDAEALNTATFEPLDDGRRCRLTLVTEHQNRRNRDLHVESGMEGGVQEGFDIIDELATQLG
ncbi:SRPBCC family protein [Jatrophihabitans sp. YIM 134969]